MKLVDLNPQFLDSHDGRRGVGVLFDCPCGNNDENHGCFVPFKVALDGSPGGHGEKGWARTGDTFETLTLTPSIFRRTSDCRGATNVTDPLPCGWHGFITNGEVITV